MKKRFFVALGAISIVVAGMLVVACTPDVANSPDVQVNEVVQRAPAAAEQGSEDAWADFNAQVEALNERYASNTNGRISVPPSDFEIDPNWDIPGRDITGALEGLNRSRAVSTNSNPSIMHHITIITSAIYSYYSFRAVLEDDALNVIVNYRSLAAINNLTNSHSTVQVGKGHNQLLYSLLTSGFDSRDMSYQQVMQAFIDKYEELFSFVPLSAKNILLTTSLTETVVLPERVRQSNTSYKTATQSMSLLTKRNYTDDYLNVVNASQVADYDKLQMCMYAAMSYYSGALWLVQ